MSENSVYKWVAEIADQKPEKFSEYFYGEIWTYITNVGLGDEREKELLMCKTKEEVKAWMDRACSYIVMNLDLELILSDYLG